MFLKIITFHLFAFLLLFTFLFIVLLNLFIYIFFSPSTFSGTHLFTVRTINKDVLRDFPGAPTYVYPPGHKTERELVEEREQRMKENDTKMMQIKEKEEELKKIEEKFVMALSTAIDKWVEHANDEGWLTSFV